MSFGIIVIIVAFIAICIFIDKKIWAAKKAKKEQLKKDEAEKRTKQAVETEKNKYKTNPNVLTWAEEVAQDFYGIIKKDKLIEHSVEVRAYTNGVTVGQNLYSIFSSWNGAIIENTKKEEWFIYTFSKYNLPDLNNSQSLTIFANAFAETIKECLAKKNINVSVNKMKTDIDDKGYQMKTHEKVVGESFFGKISVLEHDVYLSIITYEPPKATGTW